MSKYRTWSTHCLLDLVEAKERVGDPVPVDIVVELEDRGIIVTVEIEAEDD